MRVIKGPDTTDKVIHNIYPDGISVNPDMMNPHVGGWNKKCRHVYEYIGQPICPDCGRDTHETDVALQTKLHKQWIADGKHLDMKCPLGGTIRGWWDI